MFNVKVYINVFLLVLINKKFIVLLLLFLSYVWLSSFIWRLNVLVIDLKVVLKLLYCFKEYSVDYDIIIILVFFSFFWKLLWWKVFNRRYFFL